ncbi:MAG: CDP-diacylglycerol--glycerol-3-phosphate 3-phosphatidyltransferase [Minwuiales bacterium]|nr:CDP-diacylglycerol--glycerol-3-phosphate 3-phosphatidyltransferase [Minwuiales bacterium]
MLTTLPNLLTLSRIVVIPALVAAFYLPGTMANWVTFALFAAAGVTDYFDGALARKHGITSAFGRFLDPVADKLLVAATILMLVAVDRVIGWHILPALIILCREIFVSGLREFLAELRVGMPVTKLAKWKTATQITALSVLLIGDAGWAPLHLVEVGLGLLWVAGVLTLVTGYDYLRAGLKHMVDEQPSGSQSSDAPRPPTRRAG